MTSWRNNATLRAGLPVPRILHILAFLVGAVGIFFAVRSFFADTPGNGARSLMASICVLALTQARRRYLESHPAPVTPKGPGEPGDAAG
jgi:hypothetical protein